METGTVNSLNVIQFSIRPVLWKMCLIWLKYCTTGTILLSHCFLSVHVTVFWVLDRNCFTVCGSFCNYCTLVVELKYERRTSTWQSTQRSNQWGVIVFDRCWLKNCSLETCHICKQHKYCQCSFYFYQSVKVQFSLQVKMRGLMPYSVLINAVKIHTVLNLCFLL